MQNQLPFNQEFPWDEILIQLPNLWKSANYRYPLTVLSQSQQEELNTALLNRDYQQFKNVFQQVTNLNLPIGMNEDGSISLLNGFILDLVPSNFERLNEFNLDSLMRLATALLTFSTLENQSQLDRRELQSDVATIKWMNTQPLEIQTMYWNTTNLRFSYPALH